MHRGLIVDDEILTLDEEHRYRLNGQVIPGVSWILKTCGVIDTRWFTEEGRERGRKVHRICELMDKGTLEPFSIDPRLWGWIDAYETFRNEMKPKVLLNEKRLYHPLLIFGGTLDRLIRFPDKRLALIDIKTGQASDWAALQMAGYEMLLTIRKEYAGQLIQRYALELKENGAYRLIPFDDTTDKHVFAGMLATANWFVKTGRAAY